MLEAALEYVAQGRAVFPVTGKRPLVAGGFHSATTDAAQVRQWWDRWPDAGIGIPTGARGGFWALDIDPGAGGDDSILELQCANDDLPQTSTVSTGGGGLHYWFIWTGDAEIRCSAGRIAPGIDVRGTGGYVVAPPSAHPSGGTYSWYDDSPMCTAPDWLVGLLLTSNRQDSSSDTAVRGDVQLPAGTRADGLMRLACQLIALGYPRQAVTAALIEVGRINCTPPADPDYIRSLVADLTRRYSAGDLNLTIGRQRERAEIAEALDEWVRQRPPLDGQTHNVLALELSAQLAAGTGAGVAPVHDRGELWTYGGAVWRPMPPAVVGQTLQRWEGRDLVVGRDKAGEPVIGKLRINNAHVTGALACLDRSSTRLGFFDAAPPGIALQNGFVRAGEGGRIDLLPHSPDHRAIVQSPCTWTHPSRADRWREFLQTTLKGSRVCGDLGCTGCPQCAADGAAKVALLQEFFGAVLLGLATRFQKCLILHGPAGNGKSQVINVLSGILPPGTVTAVPPHMFGEPYYIARLAGSWLNAQADLPNKRIAGGPFKQLVTGDMINGRNPHGVPFDFRPRGAHLFAMNNFVSTTDNSQGFWDRVMLLEMPVRRRGTAEQIREISELLLAEERDGIMVWALDGARRLMVQDGYTVPPSMELQLTEWRESGDRVAGFIRECCAPCVRSQGARVASLREAFTEWDRRHGGTGRMSALVFRERLAALGFSAIKYKGRRGTTLLRVIPPMGDPHDWPEDLGDGGLAGIH